MFYLGIYYFLVCFLMSKNVYFILFFTFVYNFIWTCMFYCPGMPILQSCWVFLFLLLLLNIIFFIFPIHFECCYLLNCSYFCFKQLDEGIYISDWIKCHHPSCWTFCRVCVYYQGQGRQKLSVTCILREGNRIYTQ